MTNEILIAYIAAIASLIVSTVTYFQSHIEQKRLREEFEKSQKRTSTIKILELRLEHYPRAFEITQMLIKIKGDNFDPDNVKEILKEINKWRSGILRLIISDDSQDVLFELLNALRSNPANNGSYSKEQADKIWEARNKLRNKLRKDIGILHSEDENKLNR